MRFAGTIPQEIRPLIAGANTEDTSQWPSIKDIPGRGAPTNNRYDEHMKMIVPSIPARLRKA